MLNEVCRECKNWFITEVKTGTFTIENGAVKGLEAQEGQYFRIVGSVFNDGIYQFPTTSLKPETFKGGVWLMAVSEEFLTLVSEIDSWCQKYGDATPYTSESFGGYSYAKSADKSTWQGAFGSKLNRWRKI